MAYYTCERHKATGPCEACKNEQAFTTEQIFRDFSPLPEYRDFNVGAYGRPDQPNPYSKCPVCGGDTGVCRCVTAGMEPNRLGAENQRRDTPGNTDYTNQDGGWFDNYQQQREQAARQQRNAAANTPESVKKIAMHAFQGNFLGMGSCKICGNGKTSSCHWQ